MNQNLHSRRWLTVMTTVGVLVLSAFTVWGVRKPHDASKKAQRQVSETPKPLGTFGAGIQMPQIFSSSAGIAGQNSQGSAPRFNVNGSAKLSRFTAPRRVAPVSPLRACVTYDADNNYGMVNVTPEGLVVLREHEGLQAAWGGAGVGSQYYFNTCADVVSGYVQGVETYLWDTDTWTCIGYDQGPDLNVLSYSMTSHPVTEIVYGCFFSSDLQQLEIGTLDPMSMKRTGVIGACDTPLYALGFSSEGILYGIDAQGALYSVSLTDAKLTKVADTGITTTYNTTGTIDTFTDVFYYAACPKGPSDDPTRDWALYSIDLKDNYKVEKCWELNSELGGMYVANQAAKPAAPAAPVLNGISFADGNLGGKISFTAPDKTFEGNVLAGELDYGVIANDKVILNGKINAGESTEVSYTFPEAELYSIRVFVSNSVGDSPKSNSVVRWIGNGKPVKPESLTANYSYVDSNITLSWTPVEEAVFEGYINPAEVTYTILRSIDAGEPTIIADGHTGSTFTDNIATGDECHIYRYVVTANYKEQTSDAAETENIGIGIITPPFAPDFASELVDGYFSTKDYLGAGMKWRYSTYDEAMQMIWNAGWNVANMDAALYTLPVRLEAGKSYEIAYNAWVESSNILGVGLQWGKNLDSPETLIEPESISPQNSSYLNPLHHQCVVTPTEDGTYIFSVRALASSAQTVKMFVRDFTISKGLSTKAPDMVSEVSMTPDFNGSKKIEVSFKAPTQTIEGKSLTDVSKIEVSRDGNIVHIFRNPTFGQKLTFTDTGKENTDVTYIITPYNTEGQGKSWYGTSHMGVNMPVSPVDCQIVENPDVHGEVTITWTPVATDIRGYDFDPSLLRYAIFASDYETMVATNIPASQSKTTFRAVAPNSGQKFVWYCVVPYTEGGVNGYDGGFGKTPMIPVGTPFSLPYAESFEGMALHYPMGQYGSSVRIAQSISSQHLTIGSQDNDNGLVSWYTTPGSSVELRSGNIRIDDTDDVAMSFYYAGVPDMEGYLITPFIICGGERSLLCAPIDTRYCAEKGWNRVQASLLPWRGKTIQFCFNVLCQDNSFGFGLDNIILKRYAANDLRAGAVTGPSILTVGKNHEIFAEVANDGSDDAPAGYSIDLFANGVFVQSTEGPALDAFGTARVNFTYMPSPFSTEEESLLAYVNWKDDEIPDNNESKPTVFALQPSSYPGVVDLSADLDEPKGETTLEWSEPAHEAQIREITESFESYDPFVITGFGDWTVYDGDGEETWYVGRPVYDSSLGKNAPSYPNGTTPKAWMVIDQTQMRIDYDGARTGNKAAMATSIPDVADDWLISPELPGIAQQVSFYAATAPEDCGAESFEFYYSTTGDSPEDFILLGETEEVPEGEWVEDEYGDEVQVTTWYEYTYNLPEGTRYFAIRYVSDDIYALLIDDITFSLSDEVLALQGYNLFRNGVRLNAEPITANAFADDMHNLATGDYSYAVETIYDKGNSGLSNFANVNWNKTNSVSAIANGINIRTTANAILISGLDGEVVSVSNASGIKIFNSSAQGSLRIVVEPGIYIVNVNGRSLKVIVR